MFRFYLQWSKVIQYAAIRNEEIGRPKYLQNKDKGMDMGKHTFILIISIYLLFNMLFRYCCPLKSLNVLRIIANKQTKPCFATYLQKISMTFDVGSIQSMYTFKCLEGGFDWFLFKVQWRFHIYFADYNYYIHCK